MIFTVPVPTRQAAQVDVSSRTRILLIEDNDTSRQLMGEYLEYHGYEVCSLSRGNCANSTIDCFRPHVILLDLKLPDVDGFTLLEQFQQRPDWGLIPIIVVSAFAFQSDQQRALGLGACRYLVKPVNLLQLRRTITDELSLVPY
ncbi:response regulator [Egbenema bharatensis]|uniref:response regulator n=1 Tax=Egbenema bharatensis TaxID=3463334 RepID=UPI003A835A06